MVIDNGQAQRHIDAATERIFNMGIDNASQADLMFFGFGYLARVIEKTRPTSSFGSKKLLPLAAVVGAGAMEAVQFLISALF